jgi:hypothetical protein
MRLFSFNTKNTKDFHKVHKEIKYRKFLLSDLCAYFVNFVVNI